MEREFSENNGILKKTLQFGIGVLSGVAVAAVTALLLSFVMTLSFVPDGATSVAAVISSLSAALACGFVTVKLIGSGGLVYGALSGAVLFAVRAVFSLILAGPFVFTDFLIAMLLDVFFGALGGVIAVNTGKQ